MPEIFISFKAEDANELRELVRAYLAAQNPPITNAERDAAGLFEAPSSPEEIADAATLTDEEWDAKHDPHRNNGGGEPEPPAPEPPAPEPPAKRARAARAPRVSAAPPPVSPAPAAPPEDLPPLDTLKSVVTAAVRLAQKGEGSRAILDLLPGFKDTTGLAFVMNAEDKHRVALYDLVQAAGLPVV